MYLLAAEYISSNISKGEVLLFRRGHKDLSFPRSEDEESRGTSSNEKASAIREAPADLADESNVGVQRQQGVLHWKDLSYDISIKGKERRILDHVNGWVKPGTLTALMVCFEIWRGEM